MNHATDLALEGVAHRLIGRVEDDDDLDGDVRRRAPRHVREAAQQSIGLLSAHDHNGHARPCHGGKLNHRAEPTLRSRALRPAPT
ncbi:MAG: hypothetical protein WKF99_10215, partial [Solirubrobacteraceae bacterium]